MSSFFWPFQKKRIGLAFSDRLVLAICNGGPLQIAMRELPVGLIAPSSVTPNIRSVAELAQLAEDALGELEARREGVVVLLPDRSIVTALYTSRRGASEKELKVEMGAKLAFPSTEARFDFWRGRGGAVLGAAVREAVAEQYEQVVEATDSRLGWVDSTSLARIPAWARPSGGSGLDVQLQLYENHYCLSVFVEGSLVDLRIKLRPAGILDGVQREVTRLPALHGVALGAITVLGEGAAALAAALEEIPDVGRVHVEDDGEERLLASALKALLERPRP
ncbi:MAG: hypothetical protein E2P02_14455 [Acidobacteria bacterium]|nr:MAG: hypothetical protein E2P02_14455 [Acidobacteriota bacterium]